MRKNHLDSFTPGLVQPTLQPLGNFLWMTNYSEEPPNCKQNHILKNVLMWVMLSHKVSMATHNVHIVNEWECTYKNTKISQASHPRNET